MEIKNKLFNDLKAVPEILGKQLAKAEEDLVNNSKFLDFILGQEELEMYPEHKDMYEQLKEEMPYTQTTLEVKKKAISALEKILKDADEQHEEAVKDLLLTLNQLGLYQNPYTPKFGGK